MDDLQSTLEGFAQSVITGSDEFDRAIVEQGAITPRTRVDIYRNAYRQRLRSCIEVDHEILSFYLGDDLFEKMVSGYIDAYPSKCPSLRDFCGQLPKFLSETQPFSDHSVLADIARFERMLLWSFDAAGRERVGPDALLGLSADKWPQVTFQFHPSTQIYVTDWNAVQIWQAIKREREPDAAQTDTRYHWLVFRDPERLTSFRSLPPAELAAMEHMLSFGSFADMCELLLDFFPEEQVGQQALQLTLSWFDEGLISLVESA